METIGLILSPRDRPCSRPAIGGTYGAGHCPTPVKRRCKAMWVIWENETSSQDAGGVVCSLYLDTTESHGCRGEGLRAGGGGGLKCDTKITTYRVVNMSQSCTCLLKGFGFDSNKT